MEIFLVGGAVRDQLLNYPYSEKDWVVVGATPEDLTQQGFRPVGKDFPVFLHPQTGEEYALARTEKKVAPGYKGFHFYTDPSVTLEQDLQRRDLTINAMAQDDQGHIIDPYGGQADIKSKLLRHIAPAFSEDPVRILRIARFAARYHHLGFTVAKETMSLMQEMVAAGETKHLVQERVWQEINKALQEKSPCEFFNILRKSNSLTDILNEINTVTFDLHLAQLERVSQQSSLPEVRFAALCYPLNQATIESICQRLTIPNHYRELAVMASQYCDPLSQTKALSAPAIAEILQATDVLRKPERFKKLLLCCSLLMNEKSNFIYDFWINSTAPFQQVDPKQLIAEGYTKASLGNAIFQKRIEQLNDWMQTR